MLEFRQFITEKNCSCGDDCPCEGNCGPDCDCHPDCEPKEIDEALTLQQRQKRARQMRKYASRIKIGREKAKRRTADPKRLKRRAQKQARMMIANKLAKGNYKDMSFARKQEIEKRLDKLKPRIERIAKKLLPKMRKLEMERKRGANAKLDRAVAKND